jgi:hypothetical protein
MNDNLVLVSGKTATGKSMCLRNLKNPEGVMYLNCESNKRLPFRANFMKGPDGKVGFTITDPLQVYEAFDVAESDPNVHTIVVDSLTYLMDMYESMYVIGSENTMKMWGEYAQFFKKLMQQHVALSTKNVIFTAHTLDIMNEQEMAMETLVKVKGSLMNQGIESFFSCVISTKKMTLKNLSKYESDMLTTSEEEELLGLKYVFQTKLTKETVSERIRGSLGLWENNETFINNDLQLVFDRLHKYYD